MEQRMETILEDILNILDEILKNSLLDRLIWKLDKKLTFEEQILDKEQQDNEVELSITIVAKDLFLFRDKEWSFL